ncbi:hypothetical protein T260_15120 [Geobacillus thermopakistaniensis]|uniref:DUF3168 domain-containing protein n=1 Tax=Geobacillus thermopakistaniensis (strain MAS1) TaxID=1408282 RepID=A0A7U9J905_GEOTM|nr:hypothetical protein [Geobacillus sp. MAS1]ESU71108.1 hypothetical protein T260_15120 [Geobacillus sp. MAS1]
MSLNKLIIDTLKPIGVPVAFQTYSGTATTYITFFEYNQFSALNADDEEQQTAHFIQVDVWSKGDYTAIVQQVKDLMTAAGFRRTFETELYEPDTKIFHKVLRFSYVEEREE